MPPIIEFPPVDYPNAIGLAYSEFKDTSEGYGDMNSFVCFDAGFRAALQFLEKKFTSHNTKSMPCGDCGECCHESRFSSKCKLGRNNE